MSALSQRASTTVAIILGTPVMYMLYRRLFSSKSPFDRAEMDTKVMKFKSYDLHVMVGAGASSSWPADWNKTALGALYKRALKEVVDNGKIKVTACDAPSGTVIIFTCDHRVKYQFNVDPTFDEAVALLRQHIPHSAIPLIDVKLPRPVTLPSSRSFVFVCAHQARDARCGECGPLIMSEFKLALTAHNAEAEVWGCSHIGGHEYAGNVIVFSQYVAGEWFGYVRPERVDSIVRWAMLGQAADGNIVKTRRGCIGTGTDIEDMALACLLNKKE